jgi:hypothetical protein
LTVKMLFFPLTESGSEPQDGAQTLLSSFTLSCKDNGPLSVFLVFNPEPVLGNARGTVSHTVSHMEIEERNDGRFSFLRTSIGT